MLSGLRGPMTLVNFELPPDTILTASAETPMWALFRAFLPSKFDDPGLEAMLAGLFVCARSFSPDGSHPKPPHILLGFASLLARTRYNRQQTLLSRC